MLEWNWHKRRYFLFQLTIWLNKMETLDVYLFWNLDSTYGWREDESLCTLWLEIFESFWVKLSSHTFKKVLSKWDSKDSKVFPFWEKLKLPFWENQYTFLVGGMFNLKFWHHTVFWICNNIMLFLAIACIFWKLS